MKIFDADDMTNARRAMDDAETLEVLEDDAPETVELIDIDETEGLGVDTASMGEINIDTLDDDDFAMMGSDDDLLLMDSDDDLLLMEDDLVEDSDDVGGVEILDIDGVPEISTPDDEIDVDDLTDEELYMQGQDDPLPMDDVVYMDSDDVVEVMEDDEFEDEPGLGPAVEVTEEDEEGPDIGDGFMPEYEEDGEGIDEMEDNFSLAVAAFFHPKRLEADAGEFSVEGNLIDGDTPAPRWAIYVNSLPCAQITMAAAMEGERTLPPEDIHRTFTSPDFIEGVYDHIEAIGLAPALASFGAQVYAVEAPRPAFVAEAVAKREEELRAEMAKAATAEHARMSKAMDLVVAGEQRGYKWSKSEGDGEGDVDTSLLRRELVARMEQAGVAEPNSIVDQAFRAAFYPWHQSLVKVAQRLATFNDDALDNLAANVQAKVESQEAVEADKLLMARRAVAGSPDDLTPGPGVPLTSYTKEKSPGGLLSNRQASAKPPSMVNALHSVFRRS